MIDLIAQMQFGSHPYGKATTHGTATPHSNPDLKADYLPVKLLDAAIFNLIVGNADAHGENFSILYDRDGPRLAPLYDLLATVAYPELSPKRAMRIGKRATLGEMNARVWSAFATDAGVGLPLIRRRVAEISEAVISLANAVAGDLMRAGLEAAALSQLAAMTADRAAQCAQTIQSNLG